MQRIRTERPHTPIHKRSRRRGRLSLNSRLSTLNSGFLLMEVLVAVVILTVILTALMRSTTQSITSGRETQMYSRAIFLTQAKMWELENELSFKKIKSEESADGEFSEKFAAYKWEAEIEGDEEKLLFNIKLKTTWQYNGKDRTYTLETQVPMKGDEVKR